MTDDAVAQKLELSDYRRRVADLYGEVRHRGVDQRSWEWWTEARSELLRDHPQSPVDGDLRADPDALAYFDYDPTWQVVGVVEPPEHAVSVPSLNEGDSLFPLIGTVRFERAGRRYQLGVFWLQAYGGGLFVPFADETNGASTYGGGRYLLDGAKSADLGSPEPGSLLLDFNFSYHPSCMWDPIWPCPLAPPTNRLAVEVEAGSDSPSR